MSSLFRTAYVAPDAIELEMTVWYMNRIGATDSVTRDVGRGVLADRLPEVDDMMTSGFVIWRDDETEFIPPHRIISIEWRRK